MPMLRSNRNDRNQIAGVRTSTHVDPDHSTLGENILTGNVERIVRSAIRVMRGLQMDIGNIHIKAGSGFRLGGSVFYLNLGPWNNTRFISSIRGIATVSQYNFIVFQPRIRRNSNDADNLTTW